MANRKPETPKEYPLCLPKKDVEAIKRHLPKQEIIDDLSDLFLALGNETRLKILLVLSKQELCVCNIAQALGMSMSSISHQLRILRQLKLVKFENRGKMSYYFLANGCMVEMIKEFEIRCSKRKIK